jgi:hypothetical protein
LPPLPTNFKRVYKLKAMIKSQTGSDAPNIMVTDGTNTLNTWPMTGFPSAGTTEVMLMGPSVPKTGDPWDSTNIPDKCYFQVQYPSGSPTASAVLYFLTVEAHDVSTVGDDPVIRMKKVFERPVPLGTTSIPHSQKEPTFSCTLQNPFRHGLPALSSEARRHYMIRLTCANNVTSSSSTQESLLMQLRETVDPFRTIQVPFDLPAGQTANTFSCFDISTAISFGDQRAPAIPISDWDVLVAYTGDDSNSNNTCTILDLTIEAHDRPISDAHLPPSQQFSLLLSATSLTLPVVPEIVFQDTAFSVTAWVANLAEYYDTDDDSDPSDMNHTIIQHALLYTMGLQTDSTLFGTVTLASTGQAVTATFPDSQIIGLNHWVHVALIWDTKNLTMAFNAKYSSQPVAAPGPLVTISPTLTHAVLGGPNFAGNIRNVAFWNKALTEDDLSSIYYNTAGVPPGLLLSLEFATNELLVNSPAATWPKSYKLPQTTTLTLASHALVVAPEGCACFAPYSAIHMQGKDSFTIEAWIAPAAAADNTKYMIMEKDGTAADKYGWSLRLEGAKLVAQRRGDIVRESGSRVINEAAPKWVHVAAVFTHSASKSYYYQIFHSGYLICFILALWL